MTDGTLTPELLGAAIEKMKASTVPYVPYTSLDVLADRLFAESAALLAAGSLTLDGLPAWARAKLADVFGVAIPQTERIPIAQPLGQTERERGKWKRRT